MSVHSREKTEAEIISESLLVKVTARICDGGWGTCPMHRSIAERYLRMIYTILDDEGYVVRLRLEADYGETIVGDNGDRWAVGGVQPGPVVRELDGLEQSEESSGATQDRASEVPEPPW